MNSGYLMVIGTAIVLTLLMSIFLLQPWRERQSARFRFRLAAAVLWLNIGIQAFWAIRARTAVEVFGHLLAGALIAGSCLITMRTLRRKFSKP